MEKIVYAALLSGRYGYSDCSREYTKGFAKLSEKLGFEYIPLDMTSQAGIQKLLGTDWSDTHLIIHKMPGQFNEEIIANLKKAKSLTYMTVWECNQIPTNWVGELECATRIVTFSDFSASAFAPSFQRMNLKTPPVFVIPHYLREFEPDTTIEDFTNLVDDKINVLFTASQMTERKGIDLIIKSFWSVENISDTIRLIMKCPVGTQKYCDAALPKNDRPEIVIIEDYLTNSQMDYLMSICPNYMSTARGEGFGLDVVRLGVGGANTYSTANSGPDTWLLNKPNYHQINSDMEPVVSVSTYSFANTKGMRWPVPRYAGVISSFEMIARSDNKPLDVIQMNKNIQEFNVQVESALSGLINEILK